MPVSPRAHRRSCRVDHVLVVTYQAERWAIVRLGTDGSMEYAVAPRRGSQLAMPLGLQTR